MATMCQRTATRPADLDLASILRRCRSAFGAALLFIAFPAAPALAKDCSAKPAPAVNWSECKKMRIMFGAADLSNGEFVKTFFTSSDLSGANLSGANLSLSELTNASLAGANLTGANLEKAIATRADLSGANLAGASLASSEFSRVNFERAILTGADFTNSQMNRSNFSKADLTGAKMARAELARIVLTSAVMPGVTFSFSNLARADLRDTELEDSDLTGAYMFLTQISGANLSQTKGLTDNQLAAACGSPETQLPTGMSTPEAWPCPDYVEEVDGPALRGQ